MNPPLWQQPCAQQAHAEIVIAVAGVGVVTIRRPAIPGVVEPASASDDAVRA